MAQPGTLIVSNLRDLNRALARQSKASARVVRKIESRAAESVRGDAELLAVQEISGLGRNAASEGGAPWAGMRIGATQKSIYVAPREKGRRSKTNPRIRRPNLKDLLLDKAMEPAVARNADKVAREFDHALDELAAHFGD